MDFYRYFVSEIELEQVITQRRIQSTNEYGTWFSPDRYDDPNEAQVMLALALKPRYRIGPLPAASMPIFDIDVRNVAPANAQPGGGRECRAREPMWLPGVFEFEGRGYLL